MRPDDRDDRDPFEDFFSEIERMMDGVMGGGMGATGPGGDADAHVDAYEDEDTVRVVADLPGVPKDDLDLTCDGTYLTIGAATDRAEFEERLRLPARVDERSADATYNNGVLEVVFDRAEDSASIDL